MVAELLDARLACARIGRKASGELSHFTSYSPRPDGCPAGVIPSAEIPAAPQFKDLVGLRAAMEPYAAAVAAENRTEEQLAHLRRNLDRMRRLIVKVQAGQDQRARSKFVREDIGFHVGIVGMSGNFWLIDEFEHLKLVHRVSVTAFKSGPSRTILAYRRDHAEHESIFAAIARGDAAAARDAMERHLGEMPKRALG